MTKPSFVYVTYIATTIDRLYRALTSAEFTERYMFGRRVESTWQVGAPVRYTGRDGNLSDSGTVLESDPPRRLVFTWRVEFDDALRNEGYSKVTFELEPLGGEVKLTVIHDELREESGVYKGISGGWPKALASLKTLLETGRPLAISAPESANVGEAAAIEVARAGARGAGNLVLAALIALSLARPVAAQSLVTEPVPAPGVVAFTFVSPSMGETYEIVVASPLGSKSRPGATFPALIVTDGYNQFEVAHASVKSLVGQEAIEPMFVISVGSLAAGGDTLHTRRRVYEFSPADWPKTDAFGQRVTALCASMHTAAARCTGGAPAFLAMIVRELLPRLAGRFPIDTARLGLYGLSAGGFFVAWTIFQESSPFRNYIISSPAMAYGDGEIFRQETRWAASHKDLPVGVFMASGTLEMTDPMYESLGQIGSGPLRLAAALRQRQYPGLRLFTEILPGFGHADGAGAALVRGLRLLYGKASANQ